jgi:hypothetical protein
VAAKIAKMFEIGVSQAANLPKKSIMLTSAGQTVLPSAAWREVTIFVAHRA